MKKFFVIGIFMAAVAGLAFSTQTNELSTRIGHIWFESKTPLRDIEAHNYQVSSILNPVTGEIAFSVLIKSFEFEKEMMEQHFNEHYLESDKYPNALFKGRITDLSKVNFKKTGTYPVVVTGDLTIHGVTNSLTENGTLTVGSDFVLAKAALPVRLSDYNIIIPQLVQDKIAPVVQVNIDVKYNTK
jgi:polyisoprenoid-binding protein YceI